MALSAGRASRQASSCLTRPPQPAQSCVRSGLDPPPPPPRPPYPLGPAASFPTQGILGLSLLQVGLLPAALSLGLLLASPAAGQAAKRLPALRLVGAGLAAWAAAAAGCCLALGFASLLLCRAALGVGQASFAVLASPLIGGRLVPPHHALAGPVLARFHMPYPLSVLVVGATVRTIRPSSPASAHPAPPRSLLLPHTDDQAPPDRKARWLATLALCLPSGFALGFLYGGMAGPALGWRATFLLEAAAMVPLAALCLGAQPLRLGGGTGPATEDGLELGSLLAGGDGEGKRASALDRLEDSAELMDGAAKGEGGSWDAAGPLSPGVGPSTSGGLRPLGSAGGPAPWAATSGAHTGGLAADLRQVAARPAYLLFVGGGVLQAGVLAALGYWAPRAGRELHGVAPAVADASLGAITVATGGLLAAAAVLCTVLFCKQQQDPM